MASKRKFKREYIILEARDTDFRYKERILPKAFAKVEINDQKSLVSLYIENLKSVEDGYKVVVIKSDYETLELGRAVVGEQGKGEYAFNLEEDDIEIKGIALIYEKSVPLIGFKGSKIDNYEEILFTNDDYDEYEYEEIEYVEIEDDEDDDMDEYEYIEIEEDDDMDGYEYIEIEEDDDRDGYEYIEIEEDDDMDAYEYTEDEEEDDDMDEYEYIEVEEIDFENEDNYEEIQENKYDTSKKENHSYEEYDNIEETIKRNIKKQSHNKKKVNSFNEEEIQEHENKPQTAQTLLMPRQIKKGLKHFNEVKPFVRGEIQDTRWWKIEISPATLCGYTMPYLGYVNSLNYTMYSDIIMNSYKYRHYLFGVQYDEYNKRKNYIYAIPGNKQEQPDKGHTGFSVYKPCDSRNDSLGYWLCFIDSRSRRIMK